MSWLRQVVLVQSFQAVHCCIFDGDFDCSKKWYFWFVIFWTLLLLFIGTIILINRYHRHKAEAERMAPGQKRRKSKQRVVKSHESSSKSLQSRSTVCTIMSPDGSKSVSPSRTLQTDTLVPDTKGRQARPNTPSTPIQCSTEGPSPFTTYMNNVRKNQISPSTGKGKVNNGPGKFVSSRDTKKSFSPAQLISVNECESSTKTVDT